VTRRSEHRWQPRRRSRCGATTSCRAVEGQARYTGLMVGRSPFFPRCADDQRSHIYNSAEGQHARTGGVFDPTATDSTCSPAGKPLILFQNSPIITPVDITMGSIDIGTAASTWTPSSEPASGATCPRPEVVIMRRLVRSRRSQCRPSPFPLARARPTTPLLCSADAETRRGGLRDYG